MTYPVFSGSDEESFVQERIAEEVEKKGEVTLAREAEFRYVAAMRSGRRERLDLPTDAEYWNGVARGKRNLCAEPTPLPTPDQVDLVLFHRDLDGFASAWAAWKLLGDKAEYISVQYGEEPPDATGKHVAVVDFSFKPEPMTQIVAQAASLIVLDHHKTVLKEYPNGHPNLILDPMKSGAVLTWEWFHPKKETPKALLLVQDYDLWRWELKDTRAFYLGVQDIQQKSEYLRDFNLASTDDLERTLQKGESICAYIDAQIVNGVSKAAVMEIIPLGIKAWVFNGHVPWYSELGNALVTQEGNVDVALIWTYLNHSGKIGCSLRSREGGTDVSALARKLGGGGHTHASGFTWHSSIASLFRATTA